MENITPSVCYYHDHVNGSDNGKLVQGCVNVRVTHRLKEQLTLGCIIICVAGTCESCMTSIFFITLDDK